MLYSFWSLFIIVYVFGYKFTIRTSGKAVVVSKIDPIITIASTNKHVMKYPRELNTYYGNVTNIQKAMEERKQKTEIQDQYEAWKENARLVNEYYNRKSG